MINTTKISFGVWRWSPILIGTILLYSAAYKLVYPSGAILALMALEVGHGLARLITETITTLELYIGVILVLKINLKFALQSATALILVFCFFLSFLATMAHPPSCGCMGLTAVFSSNRHNALFGLVRNCVLLWMLRCSMDHYFPIDNPGMR